MLTAESLYGEFIEQTHDTLKFERLLVTFRGYHATFNFNGIDNYEGETDDDFPDSYESSCCCYGYIVEMNKFKYSETDRWFFWNCTSSNPQKMMFRCSYEYEDCQEFTEYSMRYYIGHVSSEEFFNKVITIQVEPYVQQIKPIECFMEKINNKTMYTYRYHELGHKDHRYELVKPRNRIYWTDIKTPIPKEETFPIHKLYSTAFKIDVRENLEHLINTTGFGANLDNAFSFWTSPYKNQPLCMEIMFHHGKLTLDHEPIYNNDHIIHNKTEYVLDRIEVNNCKHYKTVVHKRNIFEEEWYSGIDGEILKQILESIDWSDINASRVPLFIINKEGFEGDGLYVFSRNEYEYSFDPDQKDLIIGKIKYALSKYRFDWKEFIKTHDVLVRTTAYHGKWIPINEIKNITSIEEIRCPNIDETSLPNHE